MAGVLAGFRCVGVAMCCCSVVQCSAVCCSTIVKWQEYWLASGVSVLQCAAVCCSVLQFVNMRGQCDDDVARMLASFRCECVAMCYSVECGAVCCSTTITWQEYWLALCVSVLQRVAICCSVL